MNFEGNALFIWSHLTRLFYIIKILLSLPFKGRCNIIKCLPLVDRDEDQKCRQANPEEQILTAEFIQSMNDNKTGAEDGL